MHIRGRVGVAMGFGLMVGCAGVASLDHEPHGRVADAPPDAATLDASPPTARTVAPPADEELAAGRPRAALPLRIDYLGSSDIAFVAHVKVGSTVIEALVDTGSSGLRVASGVLADGDLASITDTAVVYAYGSGTQLRGHRAMAAVTLGGLATPAPIGIQLVESVGCVDAKPNCPARDVAISDFAFKGAAGGTYRAILGIGMRNLPPAHGIANPIVQLEGHPGYVVDIPGGFGATTGRLRIGPTAGEISTFTMRGVPDQANGVALDNGVPARDDASLPVCVVNTTRGASYCAPTLFDSGNAPVLVSSTSAPGQGTMMAGTVVEVDYRPDDADPSSVTTFSFTVGDAPQAGLDRVVVAPATRDNTNLGTSIFFRGRLFFDQDGARMGVALR